ncbi:MAG: histidine ammonia-lyase [Anaerolineae bacterium]
MKTIVLDGQGLTLEDVAAIARHWAAPEALTLALAPQARSRVARAYQAVQALLEQGALIYGVTTGFGHLKDRVIPLDQARLLQRNLILSHAVGVGEPLDPGTTRAVMAIRANTLAKGHSGVRPEVVDLLLAMANRGVYPLVPCQGSVGASGDLAPLAHMALVLLGEGEAFYQGERLPGAEALRRAGLGPLDLEPKEGVALINGTSVMAAVGALAVHGAETLCAVADVAGALSLEALQGSADALDPRIHGLRLHPHQAACAAHLRRLVEGSGWLRSQDPRRVQDAYSLRCMPQVHGAVREAVAHVRTVLERELNAAVDNPLLFWEGGDPVALSGGNFHGEPVALAMDYLATAVADLGNISERRTARLLDPALNEGLPAFLIEAGGLNSGLMLLQYTAAALASENKVLAHPASVDTIPTSANQEDHVSMGTIAARKAREVVWNVGTILAMELLAAAQAMDLRWKGQTLPLGRGTGAAYRLLREAVPFLQHDQVLYPYLREVQRLIWEGALLEAVEAEVGRGPGA